MNGLLDALRGLERAGAPAAPGAPRPAAPGFDDLFALSLADLLPDASEVAPEDDLSVRLDDDDDGTVRLAESAQARIDQRGWTWDEPLARDVTDVVDQLQLSGRHHAVIFTRSRAFRVDVHERLVTAAWTRSEALDQVFADLDSTAVIPDR